MNYLICAFKGERLLKSIEVNEIQAAHFHANTCSEFMLPESEVEVVKFDLEKIKNFNMIAKTRPSRLMKITKYKVDLIELVDEEFATTTDIDILAAPMNMINNVYDQGDVDKIVENREFVEGLDNETMYGPDAILLPQSVEIKKIPAVGTKKKEVIVDTLLPITE